jgi:tetratricopeptide (TPR) repeat protein
MRNVVLTIVLAGILVFWPGCAKSNEWAALDAKAETLCKQAKYAEAEAMAKRALAIAEKAEPNGLSVATSLSRLADVYRAQAKYADCEPLYSRALSIRESTSGPESPATAETLNALADLRMYQGRYTDAEPLFVRALSIREKTFGADDKYVAESLSDLAVLYRKQGRYPLAEPLHERALAIREKTLVVCYPSIDGFGTSTNIEIRNPKQCRNPNSKSSKQRTIDLEARSLPPTKYSAIHE